MQYGTAGIKFFLKEQYIGRQICCLSFAAVVVSMFRLHPSVAELSLVGLLGVLQRPQNLGVLLTLFQPEVADYAHHITAGSTPGFENLTTYLCGNRSQRHSCPAGLTTTNRLKSEQFLIVSHHNHKYLQYTSTNLHFHMNKLLAQKF